MGIIATKLKNILAFNLNKATQMGIDRNKTTVINLNKQQLDAGLKADGAEMPPYEESSLRMKKTAGLAVPPNKAFNLKGKTGDLHDDMFVKAESTYFEISSSDPMLNKKLTEPIYPQKKLQDKDAFGLTPENKNVLVQETLIPFYQQKLKG